jgi:hypothetical protein
MDQLDAFLDPAVTTNHATHTYDVNAALDNARRYAVDDSKIGAAELRKLAKIAEMMADPDIEEHLTGVLRKADQQAAGWQGGM